MRLVLGLLLLLGLCSLPVFAGDGDGFDCPFSKKIESSNCCKHMCPMAQMATKDGYKVVAQLPVAVLSRSELEI